MKQESKQDIVRRLRESLNAQQQSVPQLPADARARKIKVLGAKTDPQHPFAGYAVGADEAAEPGRKRIGPDMSDPYEQGWFAGFNDQNPYAAGTPEHSRWQAGQDEKQAQPNHYDESALSEFAPGPGRDGDNDDDGGDDYNSGDDKINTAANAIVKLLKSRQPVFFQLPDGRLSQIRKISPPNVSPINQDAAGNIIGTAVFDIVSKSSGGRNYLDHVAIQPDMYGIVPVLGKKIVMQVADQNLPPHLKRMRDTDGDLSEAVSPFNDDHSELDQFVKEEWNRDRRGNWDGTWEVEMGVKPFYKAKIKAPTADFAVDKLRKRGVSGIKDATDDELNVRPGERNELDEVDTANTYESRLGEAKKRLAEAESRFVLYWNGKPQTHHATRAEAEKFADTVRTKMPDVKIEIKNEVREQGVAEGVTPETIHKLADRKGVKWDNKPGFLRLTKRLTGKEHLDDLDPAGLQKVKRHLDGLPGVTEGARVDRMVQHIKSSEKATGKSAQDAENIAWATVNKRGMLDNKNKKKGVKEMKTPADIRAKNRAVVKKIKGNEVKEDITQEDIITKLKAKLGDYLSDLGQQIKKDPALQDKLSANAPSDQVGPAVKTVTTDDGHEISIHGNEDDGFRISIKNKPTPSKFDSLDEAVMACEMYCGHRRRQALNADYVEEA